MSNQNLPVTNFLFIDGLPLDFFNPRSLICFIAILQGAVFAPLLLARYFKHRKTADVWLAALLTVLCLSLVTPFIGFGTADFGLNFQKDQPKSKIQNRNGSNLYKIASNRNLRRFLIAREFILKPGFTKISARL